VRERLLAQTGDAGLVARIAPRQAGEAEAAARARALISAAATAVDLERPPSLRVRLLRWTSRICRVCVASTWHRWCGIFGRILLEADPALLLRELFCLVSPAFCPLI